MVHGPPRGTNVAENLVEKFVTPTESNCRLTASTMFKRVTKKQKKREELEELGLSDIANDDSSGSDTSSGDPSDSEEDNAPEDDEQPGGSVEGSEDGQDGEPDEDEEGSDADEDEFDDDPPMTIEEAKANPIYKASDETAFHECIVCPSKKLKHEGIVSEHLNSSSHKRRFERFLETTKDTTFGTDDPRLIVAAITTLTHNPPSLTSITGVLSNRGKKRRKWIK
ncbi:hypothetical protein SCHPADRAFT_700711 [Schizopora paradoxa]|uniref:Uncharacterized protein n=1 Tax=Schizopora paradoxa TaxID=27342 RepID=A0A0H2R9C6_9AGAM|nr:hypothetical protein SCHPADRAFT_700711 [Schizopora paradoxa]